MTHTFSKTVFWTGKILKHIAYQFFFSYISQICWKLLE